MEFILQLLFLLVLGNLIISLINLGLLFFNILTLKGVIKYSSKKIEGDISDKQKDYGGFFGK